MRRRLNKTQTSGKRLGAALNHSRIHGGDTAIMHWHHVGEVQMAESGLQHVHVAHCSRVERRPGGLVVRGVRRRPRFAPGV